MCRTRGGFGRMPYSWGRIRGSTLLLLLLLHPLTSLSDDGSPGAVHAGRKRTGTAYTNKRDKEGVQQ